MPSQRTALIDADTLVYAAATANEYEVQWDDDNWSLWAEFPAAVATLEDRIAEIREKLDCTDVVMALTDYTNPWRKRVMPTYKANRAKLGVRKPVVHRPLREYLHQEYRTYQRPGLEGDDILGILVTHPSIVPGEKIVVSIDKDMKTLPGLHINLMETKGVEADSWWPFVREVTVEEADHFHYVQTLTGDRTDGYPGCPGIGPVKAEKILDGARGAEWDAIVAAYRKAGLSEDVALANARVARILRHNEYDFKKQEVILWEPPK